MKNLLYHFGLWLTSKTTPVDNLLLQAATSVCKSMQGLNASGEYKRHQAYAQLIDQFPEARYRDLAYAIELVIQANAHVEN